MFYEIVKNIRRATNKFNGNCCHNCLSTNHSVRMYGQMLNIYLALKIISSNAQKDENRRNWIYHRILYIKVKTIIL